MQEYAAKYRMVIVSPIYEKDPSGDYYNTAAVIDADGTYLGKYRKTHIPHCQDKPINFENFFFKPSDMGFPVFKTAYATIGVYICFDRHFPEGARILGLNGAEIVYNPSATWVSKSQYIWEVEQPALAVTNGYFVGTINRVGMEAPWNLGRFYGSSYFVNPHGKIIAQASEDKDELLTAELDLELVQEARNAWKWDHERRPEAYGRLVQP
jgi:N-carbamoylputrescine amidase